MSEWHYLHIRLEMERLNTQRLSMVAENEHRAMQGLSQAYGEEAFNQLAGEYAFLDERLRILGAP